VIWLTNKINQLLGPYRCQLNAPFTLGLLEGLKKSFPKRLKWRSNFQIAANKTDRSFADAEVRWQTKQTRRNVFGRKDQVVPWKPLLARSNPALPRVKAVRPPIRWNIAVQL